MQVRQLHVVPQGLFTFVNRLKYSLASLACEQTLSSACTVQILEQQHELSFHLQQQRLIELIRQGKTEEALEHAQEYLAPPGEDDPAFLEELGIDRQI